MTKINAKTQGDLKDLKEGMKVLTKQCYIEGENIIIDLACEYVIALNRCSTVKSILQWVIQLSEKTWMTTDVLKQFIELSINYHGIDVYSTKIKNK